MPPIQKWIQYFRRWRRKKNGEPSVFYDDQGLGIQHQNWKTFRKHRRLFQTHVPLIGEDTDIFCMGSCFAMEVRKVLRVMGHRAHPWCENLVVPLPSSSSFSATGTELVHFNTYAILQEFEKAFGLWLQADTDFWHVVNGRGRRGDFYQDPYRRRVYASTLEDIRVATTALDEVIRTAIHRSQVYIFTLGLTEVWKKKDNGRVACAEPGHCGGGGDEETEFFQAGFQENYNNLRRLIELIFERYPDRHIILTVSPVPLSRTYSGTDVFLATIENKSILRTVAGQLAREFPGRVHYFPSFELCALLEKFGIKKVFKKDGRHVTDATVRMITDTFLAIFSGMGLRSAAPHPLQAPPE